MQQVTRPYAAVIDQTTAARQSLSHEADSRPGLIAPFAVGAEQKAGRRKLPRGESLRKLEKTSLNSLIRGLEARAVNRRGTGAALQHARPIQDGWEEL